MAKKDDLGKELIQCLAFAHFAVEKYNSGNQKEHEQSFYDLFDPDDKPSDAIIKKYRKYLSYRFDFDRVYSNWKSTITRKTKKVSTNITVKIVYDVAKTFYNSNSISANFNQYKFLDQKDPFMAIIKDQCLKKIITAMRLNFKVDILSSADIYIVKQQSRKNILTEFENEILKKNDLYLINNFDKYNEILIKYWKSHELFGVSLKLPQSNSGKNIKVVGVPSHALNKKMKNKLDPYTKFLSLLADPKTNIQKIINDVIIVSKKYQIKDAAWKFPFVFAYKKLGIHPTNVNFNLMSWPKAQTEGGGAAGYNGQFYNTPGYGEQWVGGTGIETMEEFLFQYSEYNRIINEIISIRKKALYYAFTGSTTKKPNLNEKIDSQMEIKFPMKMKTATMSKTGKLKFNLKKGQIGNVDYGSGDKKTGSMKVKNIQTLYSSALREIESKQFNIGVTRHLKINKLFDEYEKMTGKTDLFLKYQQAVINLCQKKPANKPIDKSKSMINTFYEHSQLSYFMIRGGENYLKKRIFLTIFGVITKKGYTIIKANKKNEFVDSKIMNAIRVNASKALTKEIKSFDTVPHFYMS